MNRPLPSLKDYYRPTRARELRRTAVRLRRLLDAWGLLILLALGLMAVLAIPFGLLAGLLFVGPTLAWWRGKLRDYLARLNEEAARLDREHDGRHDAAGPVPAADLSAPARRPCGRGPWVRLTTAGVAIAAACYEPGLLLLVLGVIGIAGPAPCRRRRRSATSR